MAILNEPTTPFHDMFIDPKKLLSFIPDSLKGKQSNNNTNMITHLVSTTEFVKLCIKKYEPTCFGDAQRKSADFHIVVSKYANFISQEPKLWMFVPCDEEGNVLEEPEHIGICDSGDDVDNYLEDVWNNDLYEKELKQYQQAQSKVLFKGWNCTKTSEWWINKVGEKQSYHLNYKSLEELMKYTQLELTETALKQIGL